MPKVLPLRYWDDPVLSTVCEQIADNEFGSKLDEFGQDLIATMKTKNGIGLAAPQVGITKRMFVMETPDNKGFPPLVICNPTLILTGRSQPGREGCLSLPDVFEQVYRAEGCVLQYKNALGVSTEIVLPTPLNARVAQHETDHLDGIMFFDYKDKREKYVTTAHPEPWGQRMTKNLTKGVMREWEKRKQKGL
jgi:peptide deformylase